MEEDGETESKEGRKIARKKRRKLPKKQVNKNGRKRNVECERNEGKKGRK
jgi:hypothetical protein